MKNKRTLKSIFLKEDIGSKQNEEELMQVQNALNTMKSLLDKKVIDPGNPAFKKIEDAVNGMQSLLNPESTGIKIFEEGPFDDAYAKHEMEKNNKKSDEKSSKPIDKSLTTDLDEPFKKHMSECHMDNLEHPMQITIEPEKEPLDTMELVQLVFPETDNDPENTGFKAPGSPNFDDRENEIVSK